jgi:hypothetical protein
LSWLELMKMEGQENRYVRQLVSIAKTGAWRTGRPE